MSYMPTPFGPPGLMMNSMEQQKKLKRYKTTLCHNYENTGTCQMGDKCHFAHGKQELRKMNEPIPLHAISLYQKNTNTVPVGHVKNNYKTVFCKFFMQDGHCSFGDRCTYAHGEADLRPTMVPAEMMGQDPNAPTPSGDYQEDQNMDSQHMDDGNDNMGQGYSALDNHMYTMVQDNQQDNSTEATMKILNENIDTRRAIYDAVKCLKSQNYEEAKKIITDLRGKYFCFNSTICHF